MTFCALCCPTGDLEQVLPRGHISSTWAAFPERAACALRASGIGAAHSAVEAVVMEKAEIIGVDIKKPKRGLEIDLCCFMRGDLGYYAQANIGLMWWCLRWWRRVRPGLEMWLHGLWELRTRDTVIQQLSRSRRF